jgi:hypothetical protein
MANVKEVMKVTKVQLVEVEGPNGIVHQVLAWGIARTAAHNARLVPRKGGVVIPESLHFDFEADPGIQPVLTLVLAHTEYDPQAVMNVCVYAEENHLCEDVRKP